MAGTSLVRCSLPAPDSGEVIVSSEICQVLGGTPKGAPSEAESTNWQATARTMLQHELMSVSAENRSAFEAALARLG